MGDSTAALENPILNSPYDPPEQHFVIGLHGLTGEIRAGRRLAATGTLYDVLSNPLQPRATRHCVHDMEPLGRAASTPRRRPEAMTTSGPAPATAVSVPRAVRAERSPHGFVDSPDGAPATSRGRNATWPGASSSVVRRARGTSRSVGQPARGGSGRRRPGGESARRGRARTPPASAAPSS